MRACVRAFVCDVRIAIFYSEFFVVVFVPPAVVGALERAFALANMCVRLFVIWLEQSVRCFVFVCPIITAAASRNAV